MSTKSFVELGQEIGELLKVKNAAYGNAFSQTAGILEILYPNGVQVGQYQDLLTITRMLDKLFRIATDKTALNEDPYRDLAGYAILALHAQQNAATADDDCPSERGPFTPEVIARLHKNNNVKEEKEAVSQLWMCCHCNRPYAGTLLSVNQNLGRCPTCASEAVGVRG